ncbi:hypothetical protein T09_10614 [Trichinella sp. T9]|nr:hypothetical protein T09_10614 [Trichinella sp. T9]
MCKMMFNQWNTADENRLKRCRKGPLDYEQNRQK